MKRLMFLIVVLLGSYSSLEGQITDSEHHYVKVTFLNPQNVHVDISSIMYEGTIDRDTMRFKHVLENVDAELVYVVEAANISDEIVFGLVDNTNEKKYSIRLSNGKYYVEYGNYSLSGGTYSVGDQLIVQRCGKVINFFFQQNLKKVIFLDDSNFKMDGRVSVVAAQETKAEIEYRLL